mmetsp:Transcript_29532/g.58012  ORF Transcript_29532/g.58012 Transcript_29532/m.58012 type:complete len:232 (-) Transcript_29532:180-875(-)
MSCSLAEAQFFGQPDALEFAGCALGDLIQNEDFPRDLERGKTCAGKITDVAVGGGLALFQHHGGTDIFAQLGVGHGKGHALPDGGMIGQDTIDLQRADLFAAAIDDFLEASGQGQIALFIKHALIAGAEPTLAIGVKEVLFICLRVRLIAGRDIGTGDRDFADPVDQPVFHFMGDAHFGACGQTNGTGFLATRLNRIAAHLMRGLRHAVGFNHGRAKCVRQLGHHRAGQGR